MRQRAAKQDQASTAGQWLSGEIETMQKKVAEAEAKVEAFRANTNLLVGTNNTTLSAQQLGDYSAQLAAARAQKADAEAKAKIIREMLRSGQPIEFSDILNSELIRRLSEQRVTLARGACRAIVDAARPASADHRTESADRRSRPADQGRGRKHRALVRERRQDRQRQGRYADRRTSTRSRTRPPPPTSDDVELRALERDAKSQRDLLELYLAKYREATARDTH